jgi:hypothetical protein
MKARTALQFTPLLAVAAFSLAPSSVRAESTESVNAVPVEGILKPPPEFTAMEFGQSATFGQGIGTDVIYGSPFFLGDDLTEAVHSGNLVFCGIDVLYGTSQFGSPIRNGRFHTLPARSLD